MIFKGSDLIISANGIALAASKSCTVDVDVDTQQVSSPANGDWRHYISKRKGWKIQTSHLLRCITTGASKRLEAYSQAWGVIGQNYVAIDGRRTEGGHSQGFHLFGIAKDNLSHFQSMGTYNIYSTGDTAVQLLRDDLELLANDEDHSYYALLTTTGNIEVNGAMQSTFSAMGLSLPIGRGPGAFAIIVDIDNEDGVVVGEFGEHAFAHTSILTTSDGEMEEQTPLRDAVSKIGNTYTLSVQVDGLANDRLTGTAICTSAQTQGTKGSLMQGSYSWLGSGPLQ